MSGMDFKYPDPKSRRNRISEYLPLLVLVIALLTLFAKTRMDQLSKKSDNPYRIARTNGDASLPGDAPPARIGPGRIGPGSAPGTASDVTPIVNFDKPLDQTQPTPKHLGLLAKTYSIKLNDNDMTLNRSGPDHYGDLISQRVDSQINWAGNFGPPLKNAPAIYEIIWSGLMKAPETGTYLLQMDADDGVRLFIDDELLLDEWRIQPPTVFRVRVQMKKGWHPIQVEYFQAGGEAVAQFRWNYPFHTGNHLVPFFAHP
jgi:hypothetical protein